MALLPSTAAAHTDDPKLLDRIPPYGGPGWRRGTAPSPHSLDHDFPVENMTLWAWFPVADLIPGATSGNSCWGYVSPTGREYAIMGLSHGTAFVDVTDPGNSTVVATFAGPQSIWRDMKTYRHYAYAASEGGGGIQVFDLANVDQGVIQQLPSVLTGGDTATHTLALNTVSGYLYRAGGGGNGLRIYSLADPANPTFVASWPDRYVHETSVVTYTHGPWAGREIAFCCSGFNNGWVQTGIDVLDVTDKSDIRLISRTLYPSSGYSHQAWFTPDLKYLYLNDELDEQQQGILTNTRIFDITDLRDLRLVGTFSSGSTSIDHNLYVRGELLFEANYRSGLRVFDVSEPEAPVQVAWFDTWPDDDNASFNGLWNNYPFFPSGTILGSDIERGLFVWTLGNPDGLGDPLPPRPIEVEPVFRRLGATRADLLQGLVRAPGEPVAPPPPLVLNEIAWPADADVDSPEWIELLNRTSRVIPLAGWSLETPSGRIELSGYVKPRGTMLVAKSESAAALEGCATADATYRGSLLAGGEGVALKNALGDVVDGVSAWHAGNAVHGVSMARMTPDAAPDRAASWEDGLLAYCGSYFGSPGRTNPGSFRPVSGRRGLAQPAAGLAQRPR